MVKETGNRNNGENNNSAGEVFERDLKKIESYTYLSITGLIVAIIFLMLDFKLIAGIIVNASACLGIFLVKRSKKILNNALSSINDVSSLNEKKDDVIIDFSHKIREPLNNLVIITDMLMESGLQKKQKDLLETFVASTNNMVTTVNELTMQSAGNLSYEHRKAIRFNLLSTIQNTIELYSL